MVCLACGYWLHELNGVWVDVYEDESCYDEELNLIGQHDAVDYRMVY